MLDHKTEMGGQDNSTRCHSPRCPLCLLQQGLGLDSWSPSHHVFYHYPLLAWLLFSSLLSSPAAPTVAVPARCPRHETSPDLCDFIPCIPGLGQHHAPTAGFTSMVPGHAASFALWELVQSPMSLIYVHPP